MVKPQGVVSISEVGDREFIRIIIIIFGTVVHKLSDHGVVQEKFDLLIGLILVTAWATIVVVRTLQTLVAPIMTLTLPCMYLSC